jgi:hypothetical protein
MTNAITLFQIAMPLLFGTVLATAAVMMFVTGRAPAYYRHAAQRAGAGAESSHYYWSILMATTVASVIALYVGVLQLVLA